MSRRGSVFIGLAALAALVLSGAGQPAAASTIQTAKFSASLTGTYAAQGTMVNEACWRPSETDPDVEVPFVQTGQANESDKFFSKRPVNVTVTRTGKDKGFAAGSFKRLQTTFDSTRSSVKTPLFCTPNEQYFGNPPDCGTKTGVYPLRVYGRTDRPAFSLAFTRDFSDARYEDPFNGCDLFGPRWPGQLLDLGPAPIKFSRLFNKRIKSIVVHGRIGGKATPTDQGEAGTYNLEWTLTLRRR